MYARGIVHIFLWQTAYILSIAGTPTSVKFLWTYMYDFASQLWKFPQNLEICSSCMCPVLVSAPFRSKQLCRCVKAGGNSLRNPRCGCQLCADSLRACPISCFPGHFGMIVAISSSRRVFLNKRKTPPLKVSWGELATCEFINLLRA